MSETASAGHEADLSSVGRQQSPDSFVTNTDTIPPTGQTVSHCPLVSVTYIMAIN